MRVVFMMLSVLALLGCGRKSAVDREASPTDPAIPAVEIVESWPVETDLGLSDIPDAHEVWPAMIDGATRTLEIAHFYISDAPGGRMEPVLSAVERAAARGVAVRLLVDEKFYAKYPVSVERFARGGKIQVRRLDLSARGGVMHAKYFIVDGRDTYLGSQNFDYRSLEHIHEIGVRVRSPEIAEVFTGLFEYDWAAAGGQKPPSTPQPAPVPPVTVRVGADEVRLAPAASPQDLLPPGLPWELPLLLARLDAARSTLDVEVLTYTIKTPAGQPWTLLDEALRRAAGRGVHVRLLVSEWALRDAAGKRSDGADALTALGKVPGVSVRVLVIPTSAKGEIPFARVAHAKYLVADGKSAWVGTSNWESRYFTASRNVALFLEGRAVAGPLARIFEHAWRGACAKPLQ
ncbi:hypothetical protein KJ975_11420 [Myxococcota bacterium]|nr:hypothetical protein [Myxococcota bacterium]